MSEKLERILANAVESNWFAVFTSDEAKALHDEITMLRAEIETLRDTIRDNEAYFMEQKNAYAVLMANARMERARAERAEAALREAQEFHPRAMKLIGKRKNFVVVAVDEPYFIDVYQTIRANEQKKSRWTDEDERLYQNTLWG